MISDPLSRSRSGIVDQGSVCRARSRTRRTSARHFPRDGNRPAVHRCRPCRLHAAALYLCLEGFHRRCCDPRAGFRQAAVGPRDQAPPGQIAPSIILRGGTLLQYRGQARVRPRMSAGWGVAGRIPPPSTVCASSAVEEAPLQARINSIPASLASGVLAPKRPIAVMPEFATGAGDRRHPAPARRPVPSNRAAQRGDNEIYRVRVLKVRIHFPPAESLQTIGS
jgi:hypothetical protein